MKLQPEILLHPNICKPLHGVAPRVIKGDKWWDEVRQVAYKKNNYHCWACGVHKREAKEHQWLEAHEIYKINYLIGEVKFIDICALCHYCHNFIHSGRLHAMYLKQEITKNKFTSVLSHGFDVLLKNKLPLNIFAVHFANKENWIELFQYRFCKRQKQEKTKEIPWDEWYMEIEGKKYYSKFENYEEWKREYGPKW